MVNWICGILGITWSAGAAWAPVVVGICGLMIFTASFFVMLFALTILRRLTRFGYKWSK